MFTAECKGNSQPKTVTTVECCVTSGCNVSPLIQQARCELDAGGPDSPTFEIYQDDESKWKMDRDAEYNGAPLVKVCNIRLVVTC